MATVLQCMITRCLSVIYFSKDYYFLVLDCMINLSVSFGLVLSVIAIICIL